MSRLKHITVWLMTGPTSQILFQFKPKQYSLIPLSTLGGTDFILLTLWIILWDGTYNRESIKKNLAKLIFKQQHLHQIKHEMLLLLFPWAPK